MSRDDPGKYLGYMGIPGYLDKGGGEVSMSRDDPGKYLGYMGIPGNLDRWGGGGGREYVQG